ncbi:hypothetical protein CVT26_010287 [Gymnopilus dilepis]|uniref:Uncharacterized protein n=1 Tax=Gymnopilus dilepis TaxID=231916 RepID=A0A409Y0Y0_9AGAR|nr:hypothetical protein CVT26_010287 [Gymnopilus dilepis]
MMRYIFASFIFASLVVAAPVAGEWDPELVVRDNFYTLMRRAECSTLQGCHDCVANGCGYSKTDFHCQTKKKDSVNPNLVITATACPHIDQIQGVFPAVNKDASHNPDGKKAGVHTPEVKAEMDRIAGHVFHGDGSTSTTGGRHTSASFEKDNKGAKVTNHNEASHIKEYAGPWLLTTILSQNGSKTVFDSDHYSETDIRNMCSVAIKLRLDDDKAAERLQDYHYSETDIRNMCSVAIKLRLDDDKANAATKGQPKGFVVQSPHGHPVCVETFATGTGSCYPKGTGTPTEPLNHPC